MGCTVWIRRHLNLRGDRGRSFERDFAHHLGIRGRCGCAARWSVAGITDWWRYVGRASAAAAIGGESENKERTGNKKHPFLHGCGVSSYKV